uniref:ANK_REP_REGION domain-containing protein n=1 Tax=Macrostomum lignano TaxID=282301 RepID=A0A1I8FE17_9PLAT
AAALGRANERLAEESRQRRQAEQRAASQSAELQAELRARRAAMQEHLAQLAPTQGAAALALHAQKAELECRLSQVAEERDALLSAAEDQQLAISRMQRRDQEQGDIIAQQGRRGFTTCRPPPPVCTVRLKLWRRRLVFVKLFVFLISLLAPPAGGESLFSELGGDAQQLFGWRQGVGDGDNCVEEDEEVEEILEEEGDTDDVGPTPCTLRLPASAGLPRAGAGAIEEYDDDDVEIDDEVYLRSTLSDLSSPPYLPHDDEYEYDYEGDYAVGAAGGIGPVEMDEMRGEVLEVYYQLRAHVRRSGTAARRRRRRLSAGQNAGRVGPWLRWTSGSARCGRCWASCVASIGDIGGLREGRQRPPPPAGCRRRWWRVCRKQVRQKDRELEAKSTELQRPRPGDAGAQHELQEAAQSGLQEQLARMNAEVARLNAEPDGEERGELSDQIGLWSDAAGLCSLAEPESSDLSQSLASAARSSPANHNGPPAKK